VSSGADDGAPGADDGAPAAPEGIILEVHGPDPAVLLEELGFALAELSADIDPLALLERDGDSLPRLETIRIEAEDPDGLADAWTAELLRRVADGALAAIEVEGVGVGDDADPATLIPAVRDPAVRDPAVRDPAVRDPAVPDPAAVAPLAPTATDGAPPQVRPWTLRARVALLPFDGGRVRRRTVIGSGTRSTAQVASGPDGWRATVSLELVRLAP
jgi:hypothetical protein